MPTGSILRCCSGGRVGPASAAITAQVIPYTGYGCTTWIRVLGRVLLADETAHQRRHHPAGARGWRNFTSVWLSDAEVRVDVGDEQHHIRADRSGIIDEVIPVDLSPGWQLIGLSSEGSEPSRPGSTWSIRRPGSAWSPTSTTR